MINLTISAQDQFLQFMPPGFLYDSLTITFSSHQLKRGCVSLILHFIPIWFILQDMDYGYKNQRYHLTKI